MRRKINIIKRNSGFVIGCILVAGASFFVTDLALSGVFTDVFSDREISEEAATEEISEKTIPLIPEETADDRTFETDEFTVNASGIVLKGAESEEETETETEAEEETEGTEAEEESQGTEVEEETERTETEEETQKTEAEEETQKTEAEEEAEAGEESLEETDIHGNMQAEEETAVPDSTQSREATEWDGNSGAGQTSDSGNNITIWDN